MLALESLRIENPNSPEGPLQGDVLYPAAEAALLITCLRGLPVRVPPGADWYALLRLAAQNGVLLLAYERLHALNPDMPGIFQESARQCRAIAESLGSELETLLRSMAELRIDVLPLKGPALARALYGNDTLRQSNDLDLLVRREDFPRAEALLLCQGFAALGPPSEHDRRFLRGDLVVELHFELASPRYFPLDVNGIWSRSRGADFRGAPARSMFKYDLVLFLCAHGLKHGFSRLIWILDLSQAWQGWEDGDYGSLLQHARRQGMEPWLLIGCEVVRTMFPQQLPAALDQVIAASPAALERARQVAARLFSEDPEVVVNDYRRLYLQAEPNAFKRWRYRLRYIAPTHTDYLWARNHHIYPELMVILRPFRLLRRYGPQRVWRILFPSTV